MKKIFLYTLTTALVCVAGCKKPSDFGNTNLDPSATTIPIPSALLTSAENTIPNYAAFSQVEAVDGGLFGQYYQQSQYPDVDLYPVTQPGFTGEYSGVLFDLQNIINLNVSKNMSAVALILQQYIFWHITDCWGDVPYSQSLKGLAYVQPAYDLQQDIYKGILANLTTAVGQFDGSSLAGDIIYNGDVASWKRMANSLRMLVALQLSKKQPTASDYAATQFKAALADAGGTITTNAQNFALTYPAGTYKDPFFNIYDGRLDYGESKTMTDLLSSLSDARATVYGGAANDPGVVTGGTVSSTTGLPICVDRATILAFTGANPGWAYVLRADKRTATSTAYMITAGECLLARAEAVNLGWTTETYATTYGPGIVQSFEQWGLADPTPTYLTNVNVAAPAYADIIKQRYIASYPDGFMAWDIYRKVTTARDATTNILKIYPGPGAQNTKLIPSRFQYAAAEYTTNKASVTAAAARYTGGDKQDSKVWWDQ